MVCMEAGLRINGKPAFGLTDLGDGSTALSLKCSGELAKKLHDAGREFEEREYVNDKDRKPISEIHRFGRGVDCEQNFGSTEWRCNIHIEITRPLSNRLFEVMTGHKMNEH